MQVKIELMEMSSDPGYRPSSGATWALLVDADAAAQRGGDSGALYDLGGESIETEMLSDAETRHSKNGACNYRVVAGTFDVPDGKVVVQQKELDICTRDVIERCAWVVDPANSLRELYTGRARENADLALNLVR